MVTFPIQTYITLVSCLAVVAAMGTTLFFLPAVIELKKPKDAGPRLLVDNASNASYAPFGFNNGLVNIEEPSEYVYAFPVANASFFGSLPDIEA